MLRSTERTKLTFCEMKTSILFPLKVKLAAKTNCVEWFTDHWKHVIVFWACLSTGKVRCGRCACWTGTFNQFSDSKGKYYMFLKPFCLHQSARFRHFGEVHQVISSNDHEQKRPRLRTKNYIIILWYLSLSDDREKYGINY
jgi:hypothetical protein